MTLASPFSNALHSPAWGTRSATIGESAPSQGLCSSGPYFLILCLSIHSPSIRASIHPPALPPLIPPLPIQPSIHPLYPPTCLSVHLSVCMYPPVCPSIHPSVRPVVLQTFSTIAQGQALLGTGMYREAGSWTQGNWFLWKGLFRTFLPIRRVQLSRSSLELYMATSQSAPCTWALCSRHSHKSGFSAAERELCM